MNVQVHLSQHISLMLKETFLLGVTQTALGHFLILSKSFFLPRDSKGNEYSFKGSNSDLDFHGELLLN